MFRLQASPVLFAGLPEGCVEGSQEPVPVTRCSFGEELKWQQDHPLAQLNQLLLFHAEHVACVIVYKAVLCNERSKAVPVCSLKDILSPYDIAWI